MCGRYTLTTPDPGSLRARFPNGDGRTLDTVIVNIAGGMTGGDRCDLGFTVGAGARLSVTTAAAEKIYRSLGPDAEVVVNIASDCERLIGAAESVVGVADLPVGVGEIAEKNSLPVGVSRLRVERDGLFCGRNGGIVISKEIFHG